MIYHIVTASMFSACLQGGFYAPPSLEEDGFVHCSVKSSVLAVADDYFGAERGLLLVLEIDPEKVTSVVRFEAAAPVAGGGTSHLAAAPEFPHVYGPIDAAAIVGVGVLEKDEKGRRWPAVFVPLAEFLAQQASGS